MTLNVGITMATKTMFILGCISIAYTTGAHVMSENKVIRFHDDEKPLPLGHTETWVWRRETGVWGVKFLEVKLGPNDLIIVDDQHSKPKYDPHLLPSMRLDTYGPFLNITFKAGQSTSSGRSLKLDVRHGQNILDLKREFLDTETVPQSQKKEDLKSILPLLITILVSVPVLCAVVIVVLVCHRRRRRRQQQVSLSVNVQGGIRRDSGIRYTRKTSTQSQVEEPTSPTRKTSQLSRSNSNRSWMVRAELTATSLPSTSIPRTGSCSNDGYVRAQPNWYIPTEDMAKGQGQMKPEARPIYDGKVRKVSTLDRVPESSSLMVVPLSPREKSEDDGYLGPTPSFSSSYLSMGDGKTYQNSPSVGAAGYENITVTGIIGV